MSNKLNMLAFTLCLLVGCANANKLNSVSIGMTKEEVRAVLGDPVTTSATHDVEYMIYRLSETGDQAYYGITLRYIRKNREGRR